MSIIKLEKDETVNEKLYNNTGESLNNKNIDSAENKKERRRIIKNLIVFCISFLLQFSSSNGLSNLQSSLNSVKNLGIISLLTSSLSFSLTCLFLPALLNKYGNYKWPIVASHVAISSFVVANFFPSYFTFIPSSLFSGMANAVLWTYQGSFIVELATEYVAVSNLKLENVLLKFFGLFVIIFQINQIIGNAVSSLVLNGSFFFKANQTTETNITTIANSFEIKCGSSDCPGPAGSQMTRPPDNIVNILCFIYLALSISGILSVAIFLDDIKPSNSHISLSGIIKDTFRIFKDVKAWLFIPINAFGACYITFLIVDFSKSYLACAYGMHSIGLWFGIWGFCTIVFSFLVQFITKYVNKFICLLVVYTYLFCIYIYLLYWTPTPNSKYVIFSLAVAFGLSEATAGTIINTILGILFSDNLQAAFANNRFCFSIFFLMAFGYSPVLCVQYKIYILFSFCLMAMASVITFAIITRKDKK